MTETAFHEAIADAFAGAEAAAEEAFDKRASTVANYLLRPELRDEAIWRRAFASAEESSQGTIEEDDWADDFAELFDVAMDRRGIWWQSIVSVFIAAAQAQYDAEEVLLPLWEALEGGGKAVRETAAKLTRPVAKSARRGPGRARFEAAKKRLLEARHGGG